MTRLPQPLLQMQQLRSLVLTNNQIVLDRAQATVLASCEELEYIDLSHNPLGRTFTLSGMSRLRWLNLRATRISQVPSALTDRPMMYYADLRDNRITHLPEQFYQAPLLVRRRIRLAGNSFGATEVLRLQMALTAPWNQSMQTLLASSRSMRANCGAMPWGRVTAVRWLVAGTRLSSDPSQSVFSGYCASCFNRRIFTVDLVRSRYVCWRYCN